MVEKTPEDQLFYNKRTFVHKKVAFPIDKQNSKKQLHTKLLMSQEITKAHFVG
jgi:hypothetical protein